jgi:hypothetical protein
VGGDMTSEVVRRKTHTGSMMEVEKEKKPISTRSAGRER